MSKKKKEWRTEKDRLLSLGPEERRKEYGDNYVALDKIPTWRHHHSRESDEEEENPVSLCDKVSLYKGDITILEVDAIVNAANSSLLGGGGVDGCIHRAAGHYLYEECHSLNGCETGKAKITCGYDLPAKYVIHTVGPIARGNVGMVQKADLASCYKSSLKLVKDYSLRSVAFPCISTGIYGFPNEPAADIALNTVRDWLEENRDKIDRIIFCVFLENDYGIYNRKMSDYFPPDNEECEEGNVAHTEDDANKNDAADVQMDSQVDQDVEMMSQGDADVDHPDPPSEQPETCTSAAENPAKELTTEGSDPVEDEKSAGESKPKQEKEKPEEKNGDSEEGIGSAGAEKENSAGEKTENAPADAKQEDEEDQVTSMNSKEADSQGLMETMEVEGAENEENTTTTHTSKSEGEVMHQDKSPAETNQATQTDSSQSKDGPSDKGEPSKE
ncbi:ADP-ribose glycohydrolase MACROD2 isoform X2 [Ictalurus punctatus]|uniref:ADP-ribose glycohydrolase MACROD2 isoform X2 n=1 Tax=Ictalurus punctatus TaxID=7998 RepID=A0A2D0QL14_ICTPU|nr:ADP-ribose glycohydrolase MACROD2 isoform X2 [Ictalurus punctatus]